jgi:hypothetical protein
MRRLKSVTCFVLAAAGLVLSTHGSFAAGPPQQLYNKSVIMHWSTGYNWKDIGGASGHIVTHFARSMYISSAGRVFNQSSRQLSSRGRMTNISAGKSSGPDGQVIKTSNHHTSGTNHWNGRTLTGIVKVDSGVFHLHVVFDEAFRGCTLTFTSGKEAGAPGMVKRSMRGSGDKLVMLSATGNSGMSCAVKDGNVFQ